MKLKTSLLALLCGAMLCGCSDSPAENNENTENGTETGGSVTEILDHPVGINLTDADKACIVGVNSFNDRLIDAAATQAGERDFAISPLSVSIYLDMLANSCQGNLRDEIVTALDCENLDQLNSLSMKLMEYLPMKKNGVKMTISNRVWLADRFSAPDAYKKSMLDIFGADVVNVDFGKPAAFKAINRWVAENTSNLIRSIVSENEWEQYKDIPMMSANAVYFLGAWQYEFDKKETTTGKFYAPSGIVSANMMHNETILSYADNGNAQFVSMPFRGCLYSLEVYLPAEGLSPASLTADVRRQLRESAQDKEVNLTMPRYKSENAINDMNTLLESIGIGSLGNINLTPAGVTEMSAANILHFTAIKVDEKGAELAAVTGGMYGCTGYAPAKVTMTVDRPFMYVVRNDQTGAVLMAGTVSNPKE